MNNWPQIKLETVCLNLTVGYVGPMADEYVEEGVLFLRSQNILPFKLNLEPSQTKYISFDFNKKIRKSKLYPGDIAIVRTGYPGTACVIPDNFEEVNCSDLVIVRPDHSMVDARFLCNYINSPIGKGAIFGSLVGVAQQHFNVGVAKNMKMKLPPLPIQQKIASILSSYDELIENNTKRIKLLEEMAEEIYKEWFVRLRFPGYEKVKVVDGLPEGWEKQRLDKVLATVKRKPKISSDKYLTGGMYPIIDQGDKFIAGYTNDESLVQFEPLPLLVFGDHTRRIKFLNYPFVSGADGTQLLYPKNKNLLPSYFYIAIKNIDLSNFHYARHFKFLKQEYILIPDDGSLFKFNKIVTPFFEEIQILKEKNQLLQETRDLLLPRLISGKLSVEHLVEEEEERMGMAAEPITNYGKK